MPKFTVQQLIDELAKVGVPHVEVVDSVDDADTESDTFLSGLGDHFKGVLTPIIKGEAHTELAGKINGSVRSMLAQTTGIKAKELEGLNDKEAVAKAMAHFKATANGDNTALQQQLEDVMAANAKAIEDAQTEGNEKANAIQTKYDRREILTQISEAHNKAAGLDPKLNKGELSSQYLRSLEDKYIVKWNDETKKVELYDKANPAQRAYANAAKNVYLEAEAGIKDHYSNIGIWNEDTRNINPKDVMDKAKTKDYTNASTKSEQAYKDPIGEKNQALMDWANGK